MFSDQPAGCPLILLFIEPAKQCFLSQNQPVSAEILPAERLLRRRLPGRLLSALVVPTAPLSAQAV
jgi:hypothetical protein